MSVGITGLPADAAGAISVSNSQGYQHDLTGSQTLPGLSLGSYTVAATVIEISGDRYAPVPASQTVVVAAGTTPAAVQVAYVLVTGKLQIGLAGVPAGSSANVVLNGPGGYGHLVTGSELLTGLAAGDYVLWGTSLTVNGDRYAPLPASITMQVAAASAPITLPVNYVLVTGALEVAVSGLPGGLDASISVTGPGGYSHTLSSSQTLSDLAPGSYVVVAGNVTAGGQLYVAVPASQSVVVAAGLTPEQAIVGYSLAMGSLAVNVTGLPGGAAAGVLVTGPGGFSRTVTASQVLTGLLPGSYSVSGVPVLSGGLNYAPLPVSQTIVVLGGATVSASVAYAATTGSLSVTFSNVPAGAAASVAVTGPQGFQQTLAGSQTLVGLVPGNYAISAASLVSGGLSYAPTPQNQNVSVVAGATATGSVSYAATTGAFSVGISGLPGGVNASVAVSGPAGYSQNLTAAQLLSGLAPGTYTVAAAAVTSGGTTYNVSPASQSRTVSAGATASASVTYSAGGGSSLDLTISGAYLTQATQRFDGSVPLVSGRDAYLRVFALANQANSTVPQVRVRLYNGAALQQTYTLSAPATGVPMTADESLLTKSWNVLVPAALVQPGLRLLADVDPSNTVVENDESNNQFPLSGVALNVDVRALPVFALRFVPVLEQVNGLQGNITAGNKESFLVDLKAMLPVGPYDADVRAPYTTTAPVLVSDNANGAWSTILSEMLALRSADASTRYYYGVVKVNYGSGVAGLGYVGGSARAAIGWDYLPSGVNVMAHELGHNLGRPHAPCGGPAGPDPAYPYPNAQIGVWGLDVATLTLKTPTIADLMSYCHPNWISDYNWSLMVSYRQNGPNNAPDDGGAGAGLLVWGRITATGIVLEPAFRVPSGAGLAPQAGAERLELLAANGSLLRQISFQATEVADLPGSTERHFGFVLPLDAQLDAALAGLRVVAGGRSAVRLAPSSQGADPVMTLSRPNPLQVELRWDAARFPVVMVRDAVSRQVLSFARGGVARLWARGQDFELQFSDGVRTVSRPARVLR